MKLRKVTALLLSLILAFSLVACNSGDTNSGTDAKDESKDNVITDITGHEVKVPEKIERVVVLSAGECEIVYALGAGDLVVGRGEYCNYPEEVADVEAVKSGSETNLEQIIGLSPDLVIMSYMDQTEEQVAALEKAGMSNVVLTGVSYDSETTGVIVKEGDKVQYYRHKKMPIGSHGTGDIFASAFSGALMRGKNEFESAKIAADYTLKCIENTQDDENHRYGAKFETAIPFLISELNK